MTQADQNADTVDAPARPRTFRPDIEGLRAVALFLVLLFHVAVPGFGGGRLGVDVFFVISGYLITGLLITELEATGSISLRDFYARRARRILPSAVVVILCALVIIAVLVPTSLSRAGVDSGSAVLQIANWRFAFAGVGAGSPLLHYWSLAVEEQFYLAWPLLMIATSAVALRQARNLRACLAVVAGAILIVSLAASVVITPLAGWHAYLLTPTRAWQLAAGALLALAGPLLTAATQRSWWRPAASAGAVTGLLLVVTSALWTDRVDYPGWAAVVPTAGATLLIATGHGAPGLVQRLLAWGPLRRAGRLSYVWYLWHVPVVFAALELGVHGWVALLAVELVVAGALAWLTAVLVERPCRFAPAFASSAGRGLALGAGASAIGLLASAAAVAFG